MHIVSTLTVTKSTHDVPVLVLTCHPSGESTDIRNLKERPGSLVELRKFVARPARYADLVSTARRVFGLAPDASLVFRTGTLDVCGSSWTEIDESAYEPLLECLDEVNVYVKKGSNPKIDSRDNEEGISTRIPQSKDKRVDAEAEASKPLVSKAQPQSAGHKNKEAKSDTFAHPALGLSQDSNSVHRSKQEPRFKPSSASTSSSNPCRKPEPEAVIELEEHGDEEEEEEVDAVINVEETETEAEEEEEEGLEVEEPHYKRDNVRSAKGPRNVYDTKPKEEDPDFWCFGEKNKEPEATPRRALRHENPRSEKKKRGKASIDRARLSALPLVPTRAANLTPVVAPVSRSDARFSVTVYGPREDQAAEFKTRAGHKVRKVLESICKTFGFPSENSRLMLEVNGAGKSEQWLRECYPEETMGDCGVVEDSRLLLQVEGVSEDDLFGDDGDEE